VELHGTNYLHTLALLSITYGGFAALLMLFRENITGRALQYDALVVRAVVEKGFIVAGCSMLPTLLIYCHLSPGTIWRVSSLVAGSLQALFLVTWTLKRRALPNFSISKWFVLNLVLQLLTAIFLLAGATGMFFEADPGAFMVGVTLILLWSGVAYHEALIFFLGGNSTKKRQRG
jgi:hypothetical protein